MTKEKLNGLSGKEVYTVLIGNFKSKKIDANKLIELFDGWAKARGKSNYNGFGYLTEEEAKSIPLVDMGNGNFAIGTQLVERTITVNKKEKLVIDSLPVKANQFFESKRQQTSKDWRFNQTAKDIDEIFNH